MRRQLLGISEHIVYAVCVCVRDVIDLYLFAPMIYI